MITCDTFRARFTPGTDDAQVLEHLRSCDSCLAFAVEADGDMLFRGLGGEMVPPGGVDAFVGDVMREVHLRSTERQIVPQGRMSWAKRLAVAATIAVAVVGSMYYPRQQNLVPGPESVITSAAMNAVTVPVIESYDSDTATIVEMPTEGAEDVKVVMIFDDELPADL